MCANAAQPSQARTNHLGYDACPSRAIKTGPGAIAIAPTESLEATHTNISLKMLNTTDHSRPAP